MTTSTITSLVRVNEVPEPASAALILAGLAGAGLAVRHGRKPAATSAP